MAKKKSKIVNMPHRSINLNISLIAFAIIFAYIVIAIYTFFTQKNIVPYEVKIGSLSSSNIYRGIALRDEEIIYANQAGYITYLAREGTRSGVRNPIYVVDQMGELSHYISKINTEETTLSASDLQELKTEILGFVHDFNETSFESVYDFKYNVQGTVLKLANHNVLTGIEQLNSSGTQMIFPGHSPRSGIVIYSIDGFEDLKLEDMKSEYFNFQNYEKTQLINNNLIGEGDPVFKISTDENWSIVIRTDSAKAAELAAKEYIRVKFLKNQYMSWGKVTPFTNADGDTFVELAFTNSMITFCQDRFIDIELITEEERGLKIPNSSIVDKEFFIVPKAYITRGGRNNSFGVLREAFTEEGEQTTEFIDTAIYNETETEFYLDDMNLRIGDYLIMPDSTEKYTISKRGVLTGVYNVNKGYADFKQINILYQNEEYAIVRSNTQYGLSVYDYIVLDAKTVAENELIYE
ncbi:MAG: hypothetical protein FWC09_07025 [Lachnospiraceae bacterium]|nr:hypothetical protein [Lachnospiraceae bacterium]